MERKSGVKYGHVSPRIVMMVMFLSSALERLGLPFTITSGEDSHLPPDIHARGDAVDIRTKTWYTSIASPRDRAARLEAARSFLQDAIGPEFQSILEFPNQDNEHIHIEFDPDRSGRRQPWKDAPVEVGGGGGGDGAAIVLSPPLKIEV